MKPSAIVPVLCCLLALIAGLPGCQTKDTQTRFGGGPDGGTFIVFASGLAAMINQSIPEARLKVKSSGGSVSNLTNIDKGKLEMGIVHGGDAYLLRQGPPDQQPPPVKRVRALARLYGSTAHLAVMNDSIIQTPYDLRKRRVAIGSSGSGAAHSAERYFRTLGIWDEIIPIYSGYSMAMEDLGKGWVEAVWQMVGIPSGSIMEISRRQKIRLIDLQLSVRESGFLEKYPFYTETLVQALTYEGQVRDVHTFQDATLWVASPELDFDLAYKALKLMFSAEGLRQMVLVHPVAQDLDIKKGLQGIKIPLHPAAVKFWEEQELK